MDGRYFEHTDTRILFRQFLCRCNVNEPLKKYLVVCEKTITVLINKGSHEALGMILLQMLL
jgi:hypothetical protein